MRSPSLAALVLATLSALAGCSLMPPATPSAGSSRAAPASTQAPAPARPAGAQSAAVPPAARTPGATLRAFATAYINWNAQTVSGTMAILAAASLGPARSAMALAARRTAGDYELHRGGIANHGQVEAIAPLAGGRDRYVVVTREQTTSANTNAYQGLRPAWHLILATVTRHGAGWVVTGWQPES